MPAKKLEALRGLRLTLPGAPETWHHLPDQGIWAHPVHPTPVGGPGEPTVADAATWAQAPGAPVELVDVTDITAARQALDTHLRTLRGLAPRIIDSAQGDEALIAAAQTEAP